MTSLTTNLRKAAILIRSVDGETAASLLARLAPEEVAEIRRAIQSLGPIDAEEQADVAAEFRRVGPLFAAEADRGVELAFSDPVMNAGDNEPIASKPFEFLEHARVESLVPYLAREHAQTVAVVLSYLAPRRAADVLAALPEHVQAETLQRLTALGDTDPASLQVVERELAEWVERQQQTRTRRHEPNRPTDNPATALLAAADDAVRQRVLANLMKVDRDLAEQIAPAPPTEPTAKSHAEPAATKPTEPPEPPAHRQSDWPATDGGQAAKPQPAPGISVPSPAPPTERAEREFADFDDLARLDEATLARVLRAVDAEVWSLALAAASDEVVERIAGQLPRKAAKAFRRRLRQLGPTRLRDVETAQTEVLAVVNQIVEPFENRRPVSATALR